MEKEIIIGVSVAVAVVSGVHVWLHRLLKFKMDEGAILQFLESFEGNDKIHSTNAISTGSGIAVARVTIVCDRSKSIFRASKEKGAWCLRKSECV